MKTNACRILDSLGIAYSTRDYPVDLEDLSGESVAQKIGMPPGQVFKTLLSRVDNGAVVFVVLSVADELDFKKLAASAGGKRAELVSLKDVQPLTGYVRGGVTAFGSKKAFPVFLDESALLYEMISVSAGIRGTQILLAPADYIRATQASVKALTRRAASSPENPGAAR